MRLPPPRLPLVLLPLLLKQAPVCSGRTSFFGDTSFCPALHFVGNLGDPQAPQYVPSTQTWHIMPPTAGGVGHSWSKDLVRWRTDRSYPTKRLSSVPETGAVTVTPAGTFFIYGADEDCGCHNASYRSTSIAGLREPGAFRAVSLDPVNWTSWLTGPNHLLGNSTLPQRCPQWSNSTFNKIDCPEWNVIPHPVKDNPHE